MSGVNGMVRLESTGEHKLRKRKSRNLVAAVISAAGLLSGGTVWGARAIAESHVEAALTRHDDEIEAIHKSLDRLEEKLERIANRLERK